MTLVLDEFLREAIRTRRWTIPQFAEACDVAPGLAQKWVSVNPRYRATPGPASCQKIAEALGIDPDQVLEMAGHRSRHKTAEGIVSARRQALSDQLDRWLTAVGSENEEFFWAHLKAQGDSTVDLIRQIGTAVNADGDAAVNGAVSARSERGRKRRGSGGSSLTASLRTAAEHLLTARVRSPQMAAA